MADTSNKHKTEFFPYIVTAIEQAVRVVIEKKYEEAKKLFLEDLERTKEVELTAVSLNIMKMVDYQSFSDRVVITLRTEKKNGSA